MMMRRSGSAATKRESPRFERSVEQLHDDYERGGELNEDELEINFWESLLKKDFYRGIQFNYKNINIEISNNIMDIN